MPDEIDGPGESVAATRDHVRYNAALWGAVDRLLKRGVPASDLNGGYVVNGWLQYAHLHIYSFGSTFCNAFWQPFHINKHPTDSYSDHLLQQSFPPHNTM